LRPDPTLSLTDRNGSRHECITEAFDTTHNVIILLYHVQALAKTTIILPPGFKELVNEGDEIKFTAKLTPNEGKLDFAVGSTPEPSVPRSASCRFLSTAQLRLTDYREAMRRNKAAEAASVAAKTGSTTASRHYNSSG
jgi:hypothetical protein